SANLMDEKEDMIEYINSLEAGKPLNEQEIKDGYQRFKDEKMARQLAEIAHKNGLEISVLEQFTNEIIHRMILDAEKLSELLAPLDRRCKERTRRELALTEDLIPSLKKRAEGREISGLRAYE